MPASADFHVRLAQPADLPALVALESASFDYDRLSARQYRRHVHSASAAVLVAQAPAGLLGAAVLFFRRTATCARLYSLATARQARGKGVGTALVQAAETLVRQRGSCCLRLEVRTDNQAAIHLYESRGYRRIADLPAYYDDGASAWRYEKTLCTPPVA